jgi:hypothetical protein
LLDAVVEEARGVRALDVRTRMLIKESLHALRERWGDDVLHARVSAPDTPARLSDIVAEKFDKQGFPSLLRRTMETTKAETVLQFLRDLSGEINQPARIDIGGSTALILEGLLFRRTEDIDVVDEVPAPLRSKREVLARLAERYDLRLAHFQSHYLPNGWENRTHVLGRFGELEVRLVDALDIFVGKLFSRREKDLDDLRALAPQIDRAKIEERLQSAAECMLSDPALRANAEKNWWIVFGAKLPNAH